MEQYEAYQRGLSDGIIERDRLAALNKELVEFVEKIEAQAHARWKKEARAVLAKARS